MSKLQQIRLLIIFLFFLARTVFGMGTKFLVPKNVQDAVRTVQASKGGLPRSLPTKAIPAGGIVMNAVRKATALSSSTESFPLSESDLVASSTVKNEKKTSQSVSKVTSSQQSNVFPNNVDVNDVAQYSSKTDSSKNKQLALNITAPIKASRNYIGSLDNLLDVFDIPRNDKENLGFAKILQGYLGLSNKQLQIKQGSIAINKIIKTYMKSFNQDLDQAFLALCKDRIALEKEKNAWSNDQTTQKSLNDLDVEVQKIAEILNKKIIDREVANFKNKLVPSQGVDLDDAFTQLTALTTKAKKEVAGLNLSSEEDQIVKEKVNEQIQEVEQQVRKFLNDIRAQKDGVVKVVKDQPKQDQTEEEMIENSLAQAEEQLKKYELNNNQDQIAVWKEVVAQFKMQENQLQKNRKKLDVDAQTEITNLEAKNKQEDLFQAALQQLKEKIKDNQSLLQDIQKIEDSEIKNKAFRDQQAQNIQKKLDDLLQQPRYKNNQDLVLYSKVFDKLHTQLLPEQLKAQTAYENELAISDFIQNLSVKNGSTVIKQRDIANHIQAIQEKIDALHKLINPGPEDPQPTEADLQGAKAKEVQEFNKKLKHSIPLNTSLENLIDIYGQVVKKLTQEHNNLDKKTAQHKVKQAAGEFIRKLGNLNIAGALSQGSRALVYTPAAAGEVTTNITLQVKDTLGPVWNSLSPAAQLAVLGLIGTLSTTLIGIATNDSLTDDKKKEIQGELLQAFAQDATNIIIADQTGASIDVVASGDVQAIGANAGFNYLINQVSPTGVNSSVKNPDYVSNLDKFKAQYSSLLANNAVKPSSSVNSVSTYPSSNYQSTLISDKSKNLLSSSSNDSYQTTSNLPKSMNLFTPSYQSLLNMNISSGA